MSLVTNPTDLANIRTSGKILATALSEAVAQVRPGITTGELNDIADRAIRRLGGEPAFIGYGQLPDGSGGFPCAMCTSVNDHVVHVVPSEKVVLKEGDVIGMDLGVNYRGMITDHAMTVGVGTITREAQHLIDVTRQSLEEAFKILKHGVHVGDIGAVVQTYVEREGFSVVRQLVGHGVGYALHEEPRIPNYGAAGTGPELTEGMIVAIEPMVNMGEPHVVFDGEWTVRTKDGSLSAHFEHTVRITGDGYELLTTI